MSRQSSTNWKGGAGLTARRVKGLLLVVVILGPLTFYGYQCHQALSEAFPSYVSPVAAIAHFHDYRAEILQVRERFTEMLPDTLELYIEFKRNGRMDFWLAAVDTAQNKRSVLVQDSRVSPTDSVVVAGLEHLAWSQGHLDELRTMLQAAGGISVARWWGDYVAVGYKRSGLGKYSYAVFDRSISTGEQYNDGCTYLRLEDAVALEYGGGAIGSQCMPQREYW